MGVPVLPARMRSFRVPAPVVDAGLAAAVAAAVTVAIRVAGEPASRPPDALAYALGAIVAALLLGRRRWPLAVLLVSTAVLWLYYILDYPGITPAIALPVAVYTAAAAGKLRWSLVIPGLLFVSGLYERVFVKEASPMFVLSNFVVGASLLVAVALLGEVVRSRRVRLAAAQDRLDRAEAEREREAARQVAEERLRIARELHDVLAHTISSVTVQAGVAADVLDGWRDCPPEARAALGAIREASREATSELRATVGVLRTGEAGDAPLSPPPGLNQVGELYELARRAGLRVETDVTGDQRPLPATVGLTAYRIVQESLTNVIRHAGATLVHVSTRYEPAALVIEVADNGSGPVADNGSGPVAGTRLEAGSLGQPGQPGHGLAGMAERAAALGGQLGAGSAPEGGFRVRATLPIERSPT